MGAASIRRIGYINALGHLLVLLLSVCLVNNIAFPRLSLSIANFFYIDALSVFFIFVISVVNFASALYSVEYLASDVERGVISETKARVYYLLFNLFACTMFLVTVLDNLGMLWAAIEMTTLVSAFLVGFYNTKNSVEAAWKYLIICSVGIILALLGTIFFAYAFSLSGGVKSMNWTDMVKAAPLLDKNILKVAFIFIIVGYGTKAGLAPMHTWLPDAHSQAITPISALLSGVLLKTALYAIMRFAVIVNMSQAGSCLAPLFIFFGIASLAIAAGFMLVQKDIKRLFAYSSIEHIGIVSLGLGIGGPLGLLGAFLHIFNHAVTKSLAFFSAGSVAKHYKTHNLNVIRGVTQVMPFTGFALLLGVLALAGFPPFSIFVSEFMIIVAAFLNGSYVVFSLILIFIVIVFSALFYHFGRVLFGSAPGDVALASEPLVSKVALIFLLVPICVIGIFVPAFLRETIAAAIEIVRGI